MTTSLLCPDAFLSPLEIDAVVTRALAEDLGRAGDVTSIATIPEDTPARAIVVARKPGVISGLPLVAATFEKLAPGIKIAANGRDGMGAAAKTALMTVEGPARAVLAAERARKIRGALRRRFQSPLRPRRCDSDQGQPYRRRRRHPRRAGARQSRRWTSGQGRDRGRYPRPAARSARGRARRRGAARQHG